jgi:hypothetical protein
LLFTESVTKNCFSIFCGLLYLAIKNYIGGVLNFSTPSFSSLVLWRRDKKQRKKNASVTWRFVEKVCPILGPKNAQRFQIVLWKSGQKFGACLGDFSAIFYSVYVALK